MPYAAIRRSSLGTRPAAQQARRAVVAGLRINLHCSNLARISEPLANRSTRLILGDGRMSLTTEIDPRDEISGGSHPRSARSSRGAISMGFSSTLLLAAALFAQHPTTGQADGSCPFGRGGRATRGGSSHEHSPGELRPGPGGRGVLQSRRPVDHLPGGSACAALDLPSSAAR